jgi:hypothetical protein
MFVVPVTVALDGSTLHVFSSCCRNKSLVLIELSTFKMKVVFVTLTSAMKVYCEESTIHGISYVVKQERHLSERIFWVFALFLSFSCCGMLFYKIGVKFNEDAMVIYTSDSAVSVTNVSAVGRVLESSREI